MDIKSIQAIWSAFQEVQEKKLVGKQKELDQDKDGDIDAQDFAALRAKKAKKEETTCPKCKGKGCDHCNGKGVHEETPADPVKQAPARKGDKKNSEKTNLNASSCGTMTKEESEMLSKLATELGLVEKKDEHTKGATKPEGLLDKESPKSKEFVDAHKGKSDKDIENKVEQGHQDVTKVADKVKPAPARRGDNLGNGDKKVVK